MIITYQRPGRLDPHQLDPNAPAADLDPTGHECGTTSVDVAGDEWRCTRAPHAGQDEHRAAYVLDHDNGPVGAVAIAWTHNYAIDDAPGNGIHHAAPTYSVTVTLTFPNRAARGIDPAAMTESMIAAARDHFLEGDLDRVRTTVTTRHDLATTRATLAQLLEVLSRGREASEEQARYADWSAEELKAAEAQWAAVEQLAAQLVSHTP